MKRVRSLRIEPLYWKAAATLAEKFNEADFVCRGWSRPSVLCYALARLVHDYNAGKLPQVKPSKHQKPILV